MFVYPNIQRLEVLFAEWKNSRMPKIQNHFQKKSLPFCLFPEKSTNPQ